MVDLKRAARVWQRAVQAADEVIASALDNERNNQPDSHSARDRLGARSGERIVIDGVPLAYDVVGNGPPVVCLHAAGHGARDFEAVLPLLKNEYRVYALDWPGHGNSGDDLQPPNIARFSQLLEGFLDALGIETVILVGNSIGGGAALELAARQPTRVRALILENPAGLSELDPRARRFIRAMSRFFDRGASGASWYPAAFAAYYQIVLPRSQARDQRRRIIAGGRESARNLARAWSSFAEPVSDLRHVVENVSAPTLTLWAVSDRLNSLRRARGALSRLPRGRLERIAAGHSPHLETPAEFERLIRSFLDEVTNGTA